MDDNDRKRVTCCCSSFRHWELFGDSPLAHPRPPLLFRRRGFGQTNPKLTISYKYGATSGYFIVHLAWDFLLPADRHKVALAAPPFLAYARLRRSTTTVSIGCLRDARPTPEATVGLCKDRAWRMGVALLRFDFNYGDLVRWLGREYTNAHRDWSTMSDTLNALEDLDPPEGYPPIDADRAAAVCTQGVPLAGHYECSFDSVRARNLYDNHPGTQEHHAEIRAKIQAEEANSFHLVLPRFLWRFILGLFLAPLVWAMRNMKGRVCVDPSTILADEDDGAANMSIPPPGTPGREDECPPVFYSTALMRHLTQIWNLRITHPREDILQFLDDLHAAFHRVLYHPEAAILFSSIFMEFLVIPIGTIFGARNSPSFFTLLSEARAHAASTLVFRDDDSPQNMTALARRVHLVDPLTDLERLALTPAVRDEHHQGVPAALQHRYHNSTFVDDNGVVDIPSRMLGAIDNSVRAAYAFFGEPGEDPRRQGCFAEDKWEDLASFLMLYLGFSIDTRAMTMAWPISKRRQLREMIDSILTDDVPRVHPRQISSLLGLLRHAAPVSPQGMYWSLRLQHSLNEAMKEHTARPWLRRWWRQAWVLLPSEVCIDLRILRKMLDDNPGNPAWCRSIGLLVWRTPTGRACSDASYQGLGGWSHTFQFMWRLHRNDLIAIGFEMKSLCADTGEPDSKEAVGEHINVLEFIALIINLWMVILFVRRIGPIDGGHVISMLADNTSALSWLRYAARSHRPIVRDLARFCMALTLFFCDAPLKVSGRHLAGKKNVEADSLSRFDSPEEFQWDYVIDRHSHLSSCQAYQVPRKLLSVISQIVSSAKTGVAYEPPMMELSTLELRTLSNGSTPLGSRTSLSMRRRRTRQ